MEKRKLILDCAAGADAVFAIACAAVNKEALELLAVTTVYGGQGVDMAAKKVLALTDFYGLKVPVAGGMAEPVVRQAEYNTEGYEEENLEKDSIPESDREPEKEMAVFYLKNLLMNLPQGEQVTFACTGPLTNVALLLKLFPEVKERIREIIFIEEKNVYTDPEAVRMVCRTGVPLVLCGVNTTQKCTLNRHQILKLCQAPFEAVRLFGDEAGFALESTADKFRGVTDIRGVVPLMYLVHPEIFTPKAAALDAVCSDGKERGTMLCDFRWWNYKEGEMKDLVLTDADGSRFQEYLIQALYELGEQ